MLVKSNSDSDFFKDKKFIENINSKIKRVNDLSNPKKRGKKTTLSLKARGPVNLNKVISEFEPVPVKYKENSFSKHEFKLIINDDLMQIDDKIQIKKFLGKFWEIHLKADIYFKQYVLRDLKTHVKLII